MHGAIIAIYVANYLSMDCHCNDKTELTCTMNIGKYNEKEAGNRNILFLA